MVGGQGYLLEVKIKSRTLARSRVTEKAINS